MRLRLNLLRIYETTNAIRLTIGDIGVKNLIEFYISNLGFDIGPVNKKYHIKATGATNQGTILIRELVEETLIYVPITRRVKLISYTPFLFDIVIL